MNRSFKILMKLENELEKRITFAVVSSPLSSCHPFATPIIYTAVFRFSSLKRTGFN